MYQKEKSIKYCICKGYLHMTFILGRETGREASMQSQEGRGGACRVRSWLQQRENLIRWGRDESEWLKHMIIITWQNDNNLSHKQAKSVLTHGPSYQYIMFTWLPQWMQGLGQGFIDCPSSLTQPLVVICKMRTQRMLNSETSWISFTRPKGNVNISIYQCVSTSSTSVLFQVGA